MTVTLIHNTPNTRIRIGFTLLLALLSATFSMRAQAPNATPDLDFFVDRAQADAAYEQQLQYENPEDEKDYWTDQRNFEKRLQNEDLPAYLTYLHEKKIAYLEHETQCGPRCGHGDYYQVQAAYYTQFKSRTFEAPSGSIVMEYIAHPTPQE